MLGYLVLLAMIAFGVWCGAAVVAGMAPGSTSLADAPDAAVLRPRTLVGGLERVQSQFERALNGLPGTQVVASSPGRVYADSKPTPRMLGGAFGLIVRFDLDEVGNGNVQIAGTAASKVPWGPVAESSVAVAGQEVECRARMALKLTGIQEVK